MADERPGSPQRVPPGGLALMIATLAVLLTTSLTLNWQRWREKDLEQAVVTTIATPTPPPVEAHREETLPFPAPVPSETATAPPAATITPAP